MHDNKQLSIVKSHVKVTYSLAQKKKPKKTINKKGKQDKKCIHMFWVRERNENFQIKKNQYENIMVYGWMSSSRLG